MSAPSRLRAAPTTRRRASAPDEIRKRLLAFYDADRRDLPWRRTRDPYRIWVSEVMLQQTRAAVAAKRFAAFVRRFPAVTALACAPVESVCEEWAGLGYYSRARNLHAAAREICVAHGGRVPADPAELRRLPGIGRYTAGAVASIAYGRRTAAVDANVERVLARVLANKRGARATEVHALAEELCDCDRPGDLNQALMDLGSLVCSPRSPHCSDCVLRSHCRARELGRPERFPAAAPKPARTPLDVAFGWVRTRAGVWLERRAVDGLWSGLWQLPGEEGPRARARLARRLGVDLGAVRVRVRHVLSHRNVSASVYVVDGGAPLRRSATLRPYPRPLDAPLSALARKAIEAMDACA